MDRYLRLVAMALAGGLPALGLYLSGPWAWGLVGLLALGLVVGWPELATSPQPHTARLVLALTATVSIALAAYWGTATAAATACLAALGVGFTAAMVRELARPAPRPHLIRSVAGTVSGLGLASLIGLYLGARSGGAIPAALTVAAACGIAAGAVVAGLGQGLSRWPWVPVAAIGLGILAGAGAGLATASWLDLEWWVSAALGAAGALAPGTLAWWLSNPDKLWSTWLTGRDAALAVLPAILVAPPVWVAALIS